jgi:hypothetical protein
MKCPYCGSGRTIEVVGDIWDCRSCRKGFDVCFGCGEGYDGYDHHCDPSREKQILDARKSHEETGIEQGHGFIERLSDGFEQMNSDWR